MNESLIWTYRRISAGKLSNKIYKNIHYSRFDPDPFRRIGQLAYCWASRKRRKKVSLHHDYYLGHRVLQRLTRVRHILVQQPMEYVITATISSESQ